MKDCVQYAPMLGARKGDLSPEEDRALAAHLETCESCRRRLADEEAFSGLLGQALMAEANRRDFSPFADGVMARIESRTRRRGGLFSGLWMRHRVLAVSSALAPALAAVALIVYFEHARTAAEPRPGEVDLLSEGHETTVLETAGGPIVLLGNPDQPEG